MRQLRLAICSLTAAVVLGSAVFGQQPQPPQPAQAGLVAPPSWLYNDIACAPAMTTDRASTLRIVGSQDPSAGARHMFGTGDLIVLSAGLNAGLQTGQRYFVRRHIKTFGARDPDHDHPVSVHTTGWVQVYGVDSMIATATVVHSCDAIQLDDYLEPFAEPMIAANPVPGTTPQYTKMGRIMLGDEAIHTVGAAGQMVNIDRGSSMGVVLGQRYLVFRDKRREEMAGEDYSRAYQRSGERLPMAEVGEVMVVAVRPDDATVEVVVAKDAIIAGDYIAEIR
jgi:hypothetical protein